MPLAPATCATDAQANASDGAVGTCAPFIAAVSPDRLRFPRHFAPGPDQKMSQEAQHGRRRKMPGRVVGTERFLVLPILVLALAQMGASGDNGALALAAAELTRVLGATMPDIQLANMVYPLVAGALMIAGGLVGATIGWRRSFRIGVALCGAGELVLAISPNMATFIWGGRTIVGLGASLMIPAVLGIIPTIYHGRNRALAFGCIAAASGLSALLPLALGVVMQQAGFRVTFAALAAYFAGLLALSLLLPGPRVAETSAAGAASANASEAARPQRFDVAGVIVAAIGLFLVLVGVSEISAWGLIEPLPAAPFTLLGISPALPMASLGMLVLAVLVPLEARFEARGGRPLLPRSFLANRQVLAGLTASAVTFFFMGVQAILMAPYLQLVAGWSPVQVGVISLVTGLPTFAFALGLPKLAPQAHPRHVVQAGYATMALALTIMALSVTLHGTSDAGIYAGAFVAGAGVGIVSSQANVVVALALPDERDVAQSGGIQATMRSVGQAVGIAALGAILLFGITSALATGLRDAGDAGIVRSGVVEQLAERGITMVGDDEFQQLIADIPLSAGERAALDDLNARARLTATRIAYGIGAALILLALITTPWITKRESTAESDVGEAATKAS